MNETIRLGEDIEAFRPNSGWHPARGLDVGDERPVLLLHRRTAPPPALPRASVRSAGLCGASIGCLVCLAACLAAAISCRRAVPAGSDERPGPGNGPEQYSARIVRTVEQEGAVETVESRITVSGQMIREDWAERGEQRALIIRPDLGEAYLIFLDKGEFVTQSIDRDKVPTNDLMGSAHNGNAGPDLPSALDSAAPAVDPAAIESEMSPAPTPANITSMALPDATVDNHPCRVSGQRATFPDGTAEVTKTYRATDLSALIIRTESESDGRSGRLRVVTEIRDIQTGVVQGVFDVPNGFRRKGP
jgi:hypothetical protein